jgi:DNA-binding Lrp family transcriptional regulator
MTFAERPRCLRVALGALDHAFNGKDNYAWATNADIANMTGLPITKVQDALATLEAEGAIIRYTVDNNGRKQRRIYPSTELLPKVEVTPTVGVGGHPQQVGAHNLNRRRRMPRSEYDRARLSAQLRERRQAATAEEGCPTNNVAFTFTAPPDDGR